MLQKVPRDLALVSGVPLLDLKFLEGKRLSRDLPTGEVLTESVLELLPEVVKGEPVKVKVKVGQVTLIARARALQDGYLGDPVRVERMDGQDSYMTRVIDQGWTRVDGGIR
jgi:flagella basal body P-ring formation protein FlgA